MMRSSMIAALAALCAQPVLAQTPEPETAEAKAESSAPAWAFDSSDLPLDPDYVFGTLDNGMRYVIRENGTPEGTGLVRLRIGSGSLAERDDEQGLAHFVEHMAFNGSSNIPEGEMIKLLEREGLAFGADTNAATGLETTTYLLDLPRNDSALLDTALMIMRETASELTIAPDAVERERGVILAERRDRRNFAQGELEDRLAFTTPDARFRQRLPIGTLEVLENAPASTLRRFYEREYVPSNAVLVVVGDFDAGLVEQAIRDRFADWRSAPAVAEPVTGPVDLTRTGQTDIYIDPSLSERVSVSAFGPYLDEPDTVATRRDTLPRRVAYGIVARRLQRLARLEDAPFTGAGFGTGDTFEDARSTSIVVSTVDGGWRRGLEAATRTVRQALEFGFTQAEVDEQLARIRTAQENAVASADTRSNAAFVSAALALVNADRIPTTPESSLARFEQSATLVTPESALAALREHAVALDDPLIRFRGRSAPDGGTDALRAAWDALQEEAVEPPAQSEAIAFAYTDFGAAGQVVSDERIEDLGIRTLTFANNVKLNLKTTDLARDRISFTATIEGGDLLKTRDDPLATTLTSSIAAGGLGKHSADEIQTVLAGRSVGYGIRSAGDAFTMGAVTTRRDLELQLQLATALLTDPGYRPEAVARYRRGLENFFANLTATPGAAYANAIGGIVSEGDPRFTLQDRDRYEALDFAALQSAIGPALANGALEIGLVGDFDEEEAIALVARTFGALPPRERTFTPPRSGSRSFTADRTPRRLTHQGEEDQALLRLLWPTDDDSDPVAVAQANLLARIVRLELTEELRERLGQAYSPASGSSMSSIYEGYGTFAISASLDAALVDEAREAILAVVARLRSDAVSRDTLDRARRPVLEAYDNFLKTNGGWARLTNRAQSRPERLERYRQGRSVLAGLTAEDVRMAAVRWLDPRAVLEVLVLPEPTPGDGADGETIASQQTADD